MTQQLKRKLSASSSTVSPPSVKRRLHTSSEPTSKGCRSSESGICIFSWNVNGVRALLQKQLSFQPNTVSPLRTFLQRHQWPELLCLQEVKIKSTDTVTQRQVQRAANSDASPLEPAYIACFSLPRDKYNATGFGGKVHGVATLIRKDLAQHLRSTQCPDWDLEGRVLVHEFDIDGREIVVINGYWVNGTSNPYRNTKTGDVEGTRHDHKLRFHEHMLNHTKSLEQRGKHVVLIGDMNVARSEVDGHPNLRIFPEQHVKNRADFNNKFFVDADGLRGVDVFRHMHGDARKYTYHPRGIGWGQSCDRVDNIIVTERLSASGAIVGTDICDNPLDRGHSDHVPLWVEIDPFRIPIKDQMDSGWKSPQAKS